MDIEDELARDHPVLVGYAATYECHENMFLRTSGTKEGKDKEKPSLLACICSFYY